MRFDPTRSVLRALLSGLVLSACGGVPEEAGLAPAEENLGTQEAGLDCAGASVTSLTIGGMSSWGGVVSGGGTWSVSYPANGVKLSFYVDGVWRGEQPVQGDANRSGSWSFNDGPFTCGSHTFEVRASPAIFNSSSTAPGVCATGSTSKTTTFAENCGPITASLSCTRSTTTTLKCTGSASGGSGSFTPHWQETWNSWPGGWYSGAWTEYFYCPKLVLTPCSIDQPCEQPPTQPLQISFKVIDRTGSESAVKSSTTYVCAM